MLSCSLTEPVPEAADSLIPATDGLLHEYVVPDNELAGEYANVVELQIAAAEVKLVNTGVGFTVTVTIWSFVHPFASNAKSYDTTIGVLVVFVNDSLIAPGPLEDD